MINYRNIFNLNYSYIGLIVIGVLVILIFILNKNFIRSIYQISNHLFIGGIVTFITSVLINFCIDFFIISNFKILIEIITKNLIRDLYIYSISLIVVSLFINIILKNTKYSSDLEESI